ncbi:isoaspartyl peptidase/L-asparaginase family protein [Pelagovum pacificum]|uniref:Isoaspartyl peptidase n=1 Tax=Pelagovum pacificum TaxID=2588711 RepID=A0A5C5GCN9_9RHOB|nr:isoaspartyl peptidase/L-asparaginase [Pelagovum pacificum]QQA44315.1 isoaspartyl peptidase/L-asparaginase [Pelagovum pacificum]TNY32565.1 isoaspartyl peptidase/L-asparaginase [Pelagovum pacificum]
MTGSYTLVIHGGAGVLPREAMTPEAEGRYHVALNHALAAGEAVLAADGSAVDAVEAAVCALEDEPLFNAGRGAVFTRDGRHEMDAAIMDGRDRMAGAVAGICGPRNPIRAARAVMQRTDHVLMIGAGAHAVATEAGLPFEEDTYFFTQARWYSLQETLEMERAGRLDDDPSRRHGTVGAVARDRHGALAAATSTGGMTAKRTGRVGDTPVIGAGTFADNRSCAVSATGDGEAFLRLAVAHEIEARIRLTSASLYDAAGGVVRDDLTSIGSSGGLIAVAADGSFTAPFNCEGMYRGWSVEHGARETHIY